MIGTQNCPTTLTWQNWFIACLLANAPIVVATMIGIIAERTDFPSASFFAHATDSLNIHLFQISGGLILWSGILYFFRRRELRRRRAIFIGVLVESIVRFLFVIKDTSESFDAGNPWVIAAYFLVPQIFLLPGGVMGGVVAWLYLRRTRKNTRILVG
jgi:hypothetical protein